MLLRNQFNSGSLIVQALCVCNRWYGIANLFHEIGYKQIKLYAQLVFLKKP
jgi:hypothetical protein